MTTRTGVKFSCYANQVVYRTVRYASIDQNYNARLTGLVTPPTGGDQPQQDPYPMVAGAIDYSHGQYGFGPTFALEAHRNMLGGLGVFGLLRG